jgi:hypothetical protein
VSHWLAFAMMPHGGAYSVDVVPGLGAFGAVLRWFLSCIITTTTRRRRRRFRCRPGREKTSQPA